MAPGYFWGMSMYFCGARAKLTDEQRDRLTHVLSLRRQSEGDTDVYTRYIGVLTILLSPIALVPSVPYVLPYALSCVAMAIALLLAYLRFRRATQLRVAPLVRRSPWASLPPLAVAATIACLLGAAVFAAADPAMLPGFIVVIASAALLLAVAWRVAVAPAVLFGEDPQLEYLVDEHVRFCRAASLVALACAPPTVLVELAIAAMRSPAPFLNAVTVVVAVAFIVVIFVSLNPLRKRFSFA